MDRHLLELIIPEHLKSEKYALTEAEQDVNPYSRRFIFGKEYAKARNDRLSFFGPNGATLLRAILSDLPTERSKAIFPGIFDLGNHDNVALNDITYSRLTDELKDQHGWLLDPEEAFENIKRMVVDTTGNTFEFYVKQDKLKALKVLKLLLVLVRQREPRLIDFLTKEPPEKVSLEIRDAFPITKNEQNTYLLSDLKSYLTIEMDEARTHEIDAFFYHFIRRCGATQRSLEAQITTDFSASHETEGALDLFTASLKEFVPRAPKREAPLDEALYVYLCRYECVHFFKEIERIIATTTPRAQVAPVPHEVQAFRTKLAARFKAPEGGTIAEFAIKLRQFPDFFQDYMADILPITQKTIGFPVESQSYCNAIGPAHELLRLRLFFSLTPSGDINEDKPFTLLLGISAICAVLHQRHVERTKYDIYWPGRKTQGSSLMTPLEEGLHLHERRTDWAVPEAILQIWDLRLQWMHDSLVGATAINSRKVSLRLALSNMLLACTASSDIGHVVDELQRFNDHIEACLHRVYEASSTSRL